VLRTVAARKLLHQHKFPCHCAAGKPVIHACCSENETPKDQVADKVAVLEYLLVVCVDPLPTSEVCLNVFPEDCCAFFGGGS